MKLRRSRVTISASVAVGLLLPAMGLAFYQVAVTGGSGVLAEKAAAFLTEPGWEGFIGLVEQIAAVAVFLGAGIVVTWVFGREHVDRTFSSLFSLPVSRTNIAIAKFAVLFAWLTSLSLVVPIVSWGLGIIAGVGSIGVGDLFPVLLHLWIVVLWASLLSLSMGLVASVARGYLASIGVLILIVAVSQVAVLFGIGGWFPYAVPGLLAVSGSEGIADISGAQASLVPIVSLILATVTVLWWRRAQVV
jgi:ABC-2 type transport system permease protein